MISAGVGAYLSRLEHELLRRGLVNTRIVEEVREHLLDAVEAGIRRGLSADAAEHEALIRFGTVERVAAGFAKERHSVFNRVSIVLSKIAAFLSREPIAWRPLSRCNSAVTLSPRSCTEAPVPQSIREDVS
jgi:hypothetical protein